MPITDEQVEVARVANDGVSLRDYFAAHAGQMLLSGAMSPYNRVYSDIAPYPRQPKFGSPPEAEKAFEAALFDWHARAEAFLRYRIADAMLAARAAKRGAGEPDRNQTADEAISHVKPR